MTPNTKTARAHFEEEAEKQWMNKPGFSGGFGIDQVPHVLREAVCQWAEEYANLKSGEQWVITKETCQRYKDNDGICQVHCYFKGSGLKQCQSPTPSPTVEENDILESLIEIVKELKSDDPRLSSYKKEILSKAEGVILKYSNPVPPSLIDKEKPDSFKVYSVDIRKIILGCKGVNSGQVHLDECIGQLAGYVSNKIRGLEDELRQAREQLQTAFELHLKYMEEIKQLKG